MNRAMVLMGRIIMPTTTERQQAADALHTAFLVNLIAETEAQLLQFNGQNDSDSDSAMDINPDSDDSESSGSSSSTLSSSSSSSEHSSMSTSSTSSSNSGSSSSSSSSSSSGSSLAEDASISPSDVYLEALAELYLKRYLNSREVINKDKALLRLILDDWKHNRPEIFRSYVRLNPETFDDLVATIQDDEVFHNKSNNEQMDIEEQVVIALY